MPTAVPMTAYLLPKTCERCAPADLHSSSNLPNCHSAFPRFRWLLWAKASTFLPALTALIAVLEGYCVSQAIGYQIINLNSQG